jgi:hypothetical protein
MSVCLSMVITRNNCVKRMTPRLEVNLRDAGWRRKRNSRWEILRRVCIRDNSSCILKTVTKLRSPKNYFPLTKSSKVEGSMRHFVIRLAFTVGIIRLSSCHQIEEGGSSQCRIPSIITILSYLSSYTYSCGDERFIFLNGLVGEQKIDQGPLHVLGLHST